MLILNFFRQQVKKELQSARIVVSLVMEQIANNVIMPWFIFGLAIAVIVLPIALDIMGKIERGKK